MADPVLYVTVTPELREQVVAKLTDPVTGTVPHGALSHLVRQLLMEWLKQKEKR